MTVQQAVTAAPIKSDWQDMGEFRETFEIVFHEEENGAFWTTFRGSATIWMACCPRCSTYHGAVRAHRFMKDLRHTLSQWQYWGLCPDTGEPILFIDIWADDGIGLGRVRPRPWMEDGWWEFID